MTFEQLVMEQRITLIEQRIVLVKDRVVAADAKEDRLNSAYHGGEIAGLHFALARLRGDE